MGTRMMQGMSLSSYGSIVYVASMPQNPAELFFKKNDQSNAVQLTHFNQKFLDEIIVQETHEFIFQSPAGIGIQGWYVLPVGYEEGKKYPLALNIHGGPHVMWGAGMQSMWHEWQSHAARGYVVFFCNPRGSGGYGESFLNALHAAWGTVAMDDIMAGVDALTAKGFIDTERMAITGGSYGGYMTAWIISHTERFKAAVSARGVYNLISFYGTSDVPLLIDHEYDEQPWTNPNLLWEHSPVAYAHKIKTPLLILHSENDFRVPIEQGEQLFAFVRRSGGTVKMIRYPREGHELTRSGEPAHRLSHLTEQLAWFDKYCKDSNE
jgi:dipeptidyl aminopeptidase/acylaminoacyl peptidase